MLVSARGWWLALGLWSAAQGALAVGFGRVPSSATLGQPLQLTIPLRLEAGEELRSDCLAATVSFADTPQQPGTTSLRLDPALPGVLDRVLRLSTSTRVDEPVVTVEVSVGCTAKVSRRFTVFADPPSIVVESPPSSTPEASVSSAGGEAPAAALAPEAPASRPKPVNAARRASTSNTTMIAPRPVRPRTAAVARSATASVAPKARLTLAPLDASVAVAAAASAAEAAAKASAAEQVAQAASAAEAAASSAAAAQARVAELDAAIRALRADAASANQQALALQTRLQRAEVERYNNPLVWGLGLALLLSVAAAWWLARQRGAAADTHDWLAAATTARPTTASEASAESAAFAPVPTLKAWVSKPDEVDGFDETLAATRAGTPSAAGAFNSAAMPLSAEQRREVSVEELIDLEQQAEFFVVLGQDAAAIDLLMGHVRGGASNSPLPYLKLLEIHKRRGERTEYERLRERFNSRFNTYAPAWETDLQHGRSLADYPAVTQQLQGLWASPQRAMEVLQATLLRPQGGEGGEAGSATFDLPAYRELMMLYSVARDLSENSPHASVDLLLPIGEDGPASSHGGMFERLLATTTLAAQPEAMQPLEIDLPLDDVGTPTQRRGG